MDITIKTIPHGEQRYETVGDYWWDGEGNLQIRVSDMHNVDYEALVAVHELIESLLCKKRGIEESEITKFDVEFEKQRPPGNEDEPGDSKDAPYRKEHFFATTVERSLSSELEVDWTEYDKAIYSL